LLGISEVERSDETPDAGAGGGSAGEAPGQGNAGTGGRPMMPAGTGGRPPGGSGGGGPVSGAAGTAASGGTGGNTGGTGGNTGGTGGGTGGTGGDTGGTGGAALCEGDFNEPNDDEGDSTLLGSALSPCKGLQDISGVAGLDSEDWFSFSGRRGSCGDRPEPFAELGGVVFTQLCYFLLPYDGFEASCPSPYTRSDEIEGYTGCCGVNEGGVSYDGDDAEVLIRVRPSAGTRACMAYVLKYKY
jgi:hypothetical protein